MARNLDWDEINRQNRAAKLNHLANDTDRRWRKRIQEAENAEKLARLARSRKSLGRNT